MKKKNKALPLLIAGILSLSLLACGKDEKSAKEGDIIILRVNSWEEYIDEGGWDADELIELDNGAKIIGVNSMVEDFEEWYLETYGKKVKVEYSTFGTNEDLYNQLTLGDVYDLVCPSDYMIMKLMAEGRLTEFSDDFFDESNENNYYIKGVSDYIRGVFEGNEIGGEAWSRYAAGYMWGTTGIVYNPEFITKEEASSWELFRNDTYKRKLTIKDNVRDSMFAALGIVKAWEVTSPDFIAADDYSDKIQEIMNDTSVEAVNECEDVLRQMKDVAYSFETDSGKADMVTGKVYANYQWSGDAVYSLDQAEEDGVELAYSVPEECSNLWFDGWVMLKSGIDEDEERRQAAQAFINFLSRPDNAVRNMYYIGYTSAIAGGEDDTVFEYMNWVYGAEDDAEEIAEYDVSYFFGEDSVIETDPGQLSRQLFAQYPTEDVIRRCAVMWYFDDEAQARINRMWINVRCFDIRGAYVPLALILGLILVLICFIIIRKVKKS